MSISVTDIDRIGDWVPSVWHADGGRVHMHPRGPEDPRAQLAME
jgi:hypothetical protein